MDELAGVDLNLLVVLNALLEERHVTRAGRKVGLSQPATSNALKRIRKWLDDPLLTRVGSQMELTPKAVALRDPVRAALDAVRGALGDPMPFDPRSGEARVRVSATDHGVLIVLSGLQRRLMQEAPGIELVITTFGLLDDAALLKGGQVDLVLGTLQSVPPPLRRQRLFHDELVCLLRDDHPALEGSDAGDPIALDRYLAYPHVRVAPRPTLAGSVADALSLQGGARRVVCEVPGFLEAPFLVEGTDAITVLSARVADRFTALLPLTTRRPPVNLAGFDTDLVWHPRSDGVDAQQWVRAQLVAEAALLDA